MAKSKKKIIFVLLCIVILIFTGYQIFNKKNNNPVSTEMILSNAKNEKVSMPYINPEWTEYMKLDEEERENVKEPQMYIYDYIPDEDADYSNLPSKYNLRDEYPTTLYNQGNEGICWAYANVEMLESNLKVTQGKDVQFSVDQLDLLTTHGSHYEGNYNPFGLYKSESDGMTYCDEQKFNYAVLSSGLFPVLNEKFSLNKSEGQIFKYEDVANVENVDYTITNTVDFPEYNNTIEYRNMMKDFIMKYGAIRISTSGLFDDNKIINLKKGDALAGHEMIIVGWDDTIGLDTDNDGNPDGVWVLQNSWDDTQYIEYYVAYTSEIPALYGVKTIKEKDWDNVYNLSNYPIIKHSGAEIGQMNAILDYVPDYVRLEDSFFVSYVNNAISGSVVATYNRPKNKSEKIKSINFSSASQNSKFKVYISDDGSEENYRFVKEIKTDMPGIYTVDVDDVIIDSEQFSVKIETNDGALYQVINVFCDNYELHDDIGETNSHIDFAMLNSDNMFEYHITSNIYGIEDNEILSYKCTSRDIKISNAIVKNNQAIGKIEIPSNVYENSEFDIDIMHNDEVIDTVKLVHKPEFPDQSIQGSGTVEDPYVITNESQLKMMSYSPTAQYILGNDIDLKLDSENETTFNNGIGWEPINTFYGKLDGNGYSIKNMYINSTILEDVSEEKNVGLFKDLTYAEICNLKIENAKIISNDGKKCNIGILAGSAKFPRIKNVLVSGSIDCEINKEREANCGMLIGKLDVGGNSLSTSINHISCQGDIVSKGYRNVGGFIGKYEGTWPADLENFLIATNISSSDNEATNVGEIFGEGEISRIKNSYIIPSVNCGNIDIFSGTRNREDIRIINSVLYKSNESSILDTIKEDRYSNFIYSNNIEDLKNISLEQSGLSSDSWEYIQGNPYPTLKNLEIRFISNIAVQNEINLNKDESKKIDVNIQNTDSTFKKLQYKTSNNSLIEVNQYGKITAKKKDGTAIIIVSTCDGSNITKEINVTVGQGVAPYKINKYTVDEDKKTISNIFPATIEHYKENIALENSYTARIFKIKTENETEVEEEVTEGNIATGMITKIYLNDEIVAEYTNIVPGDVFVDGKVNSRDAGMTRQYLIGMKDELYETPQYYAMDFTRDGKVRLNDVELIMRYVVKLYEPSEEDYYGENN